MSASITGQSYQINEQFLYQNLRSNFWKVTETSLCSEHVVYCFVTVRKRYCNLWTNTGKLDNPCRLNYISYVQRKTLTSLFWLFVFWFQLSMLTSWSFLMCP